MKKKGFSYSRMMFRQFFFSALLPLVGLSLVLSSYYCQRVFDFNSSLYSSMLDTATSAMSDSFNELSQISFTPYLYKEVSTTINYMYNGFCRQEADVPEYLDVPANESAYTMLLTKLLHSSHQHISSITFYPLSEYAGDAYSIERGTAGLQYSEAGAEYIWSLQTYTENNGTSPVFLHLADTAEDTFTMLRIIRDFDNMRNLGILRIDTRTDKLTSCLSAIDVSAHSFLVLLDSCGEVIYTKGNVQQSLLDSIRAGESISYSQSGRFHAYTKQLSAEGWELIYATSDSDMGNYLTGSIVIIAVSVLLAFAITYALWRIQSADSIASIEVILEGIRQLRHGNFNYVCTVADKDGYAMIADSLNKTGQRLRELIEAEAKARESQSKSEYLALQSQITPHFLYNTLNGFIALNRMGERKQLETSIIQLTRLFRYICNNNDTSTVSKEFEFAQQYLDLQKLRFTGQIEYSIVVDDNVEDTVIPKLVIQPLVENCVYHGMEESGEPITITLHACLTEDKDGVCMEICDTGIGFDLAQMENSPYVGLHNVMRRLQMFQKAANCRIESAPGQGTKVTIVIPGAIMGEKDENTDCR